MDKRKLKLQLDSFKEKCRKEGINVENTLIEHVYFKDMGDFSVDVCISNLTEENVLQFRDTSLQIFIKTIDKEFLDYVLTYCVVDNNLVECCDVQEEIAKNT